MRKNYSIGLDIGTSSVGWAVTNDRYELLKFKGKNMWGTRLFDEADTAAGRRLYRNSRRRYNRRRERIVLLREILSNMVLDKDESFFIRLENLAFLTQEDKLEIGNQNSKYNLFIDDDYTDKHFYSQFKTIYHLRDYLCNTGEQVDSRLIYLALHHIVKYRGNFLYDGQEFDLGDTSDIESKIEEVIRIYNEITNSNVEITDIKDFINVLKEKRVRTSKKEKLVGLIKFQVENKKSVEELCKFMIGLKANITTLVCNEGLLIDSKPINLELSSSSIENDLSEKESELTEYLELIYVMQSIYSWVELQDVLDGNQSISKAMIEKYNEHQDDLKILKKLVKKYSREKYNLFFREDDKKVDNYIKYTQHILAYDLFKKSILSLFKDNNEAHEDADYKEMIDKLDLEKFMPIQNSTKNGAIPYQLHLKELEKIIEKQGKYYPTLLENYDKIRSLVTFRIPYFVGPYNSDKFGWLIRNDNCETRITPWNFDEIIDRDKSAEEFITRLTNYCTYLPSEKVLPKKSLIISKYEVLSELNKISINGKKISVELKNKIYRDLFLRSNKINEKKFRRWLIENQEYRVIEEIRGYQKEEEFASNLEPWRDFYKILGRDIQEEEINDIEKIISWITIFNDKNVIKRKIQNELPQYSDKVNEICKLKYSGWSRLSKALLVDMRCKNKFGDYINIIDIMEMTNLNLMEIISDSKLGYKDKINEKRNKDIEKITYEEITELQCSPTVKKGVWQAIKIVNEIVTIMKCEPENIYIEFSREEQEKKRTDSRVKSLKKCFEKLDEQDREVIKQLNGKDDKKAISDRLYLYFTQNGKCMYTGKPLNIDSLDLYQVDHIIPQWAIVDDSIDNRVLVYPDQNQSKSGRLTINPEIQNKQHEYWKKLFNCWLISAKKYGNLTRKEMYEVNEKKFINRQLVETRQIIKNVAQLLDNCYQKTEVVAIRANLTHQFRMQYDVYKSRSLNDYHHAHDAYISCVVGRFLKDVLPSENEVYVYNQYKKYKENKNNYNKSSGFIFGLMNENQVDIETGEYVWTPDISIPKIKKCFDYKDCFITKKVEENSGQMFKLTIIPADEIKKAQANYLPVNKNRADTSKYGGFSGIESKFYMAVEGINSKGKLVRTITGIPGFIEQEDDKISEYIEESLKLKNVNIIRRILKNQELEIGNMRYYLTSPSELVNAKQLIVNRETLETIYHIERGRKDIEDVKLIRAYEYITNKIMQMYPPFINVASNLSKAQNSFEALENMEKCKIILEMLKITKASPVNGDLSLLEMIDSAGINKKLSDRAGRMGGKNIWLDETLFVDQSITGMYCTKTKY